MSLDLDDCRRTRNRYHHAMRKHKREHAIRFMVSGYLPALRDLVAGTDPQHLADALDTLTARLNKGVEYQTDDPEQQERADDLFCSLLDDYEILFDALSLRHTGSASPVSYLMDRIEVTCPSP